MRNPNTSGGLICPYPITNGRFPTGDDVDRLATTREYVEAVRDAYRWCGNGVRAKSRTKLIPNDESGKVTGRLVILPNTGAMSRYVYSAGIGAADAWFVTALSDAESG